MNQIQFSQNLESLHKRRAELFSLEQIERSNALTQSGKQATGDVGDTDLGTDLSEQDIALKLAGMESLELEKIDAALGRVRDGRYGTCEVCGHQIPAKRLALIPEAACCTNCEPKRAS
ncbi:MAG: TraR/DksA C4-type zinc finger protein [Proteobacteria bacterium]|nr:TraR/DksA C4-type zinc finger protein [Pseudomonadota bacterium]